MYLYIKDSLIMLKAKRFRRCIVKYQNQIGLSQLFRKLCMLNEASINRMT